MNELMKESFFNKSSEKEKDDFSNNNELCINQIFNSFSSQEYKLLTTEEIQTDNKLSQTSEKNISNEVKKGQWSREEDELLMKWVDKHGAYNWNRCAEFMKCRNAKQIREHWLNCLNPDLLKAEWNSKEEFFIFYTYQICGGSWKDIAKLFDGRTENAIKNKFYSRLRTVASKYMSKEDKKESSKLKVKNLYTKYYEEAFNDIKKELFLEYPMNKEEFIMFLNELNSKLEPILKDSKLKKFNNPKDKNDTTKNESYEENSNFENSNQSIQLDEDLCSNKFSINKNLMNDDEFNKFLSPQKSNILDNIINTKFSYPSNESLFTNNILYPDK